VRINDPARLGDSRHLVKITVPVDVRYGGQDTSHSPDGEGDDVRAWPATR